MFGTMESTTPAVPSMPRDTLRWQWSQLPGLAATELYAVLDPGRKYSEPSIGRVLTVPPHRGIGPGRTPMIEGIKRTREIWPGRPIRVAAQQRLKTFYASLGFRPISAPYDEDGIVHVDMLIDAPAP